MQTVRNAAVAGQFYPYASHEIRHLFSEFEKKEAGNINLDLITKNIIGGIVPHAGYVYSGYEAYHFFDIVRRSQIQFETIIILCPNHRGIGPGVSVDGNDYWEIPLGRIPLDKDFIALLGTPVSMEAHAYEHSAEVMLPFLKEYLDYDFKIVPISFLDQNCNTAREIAGKIENANSILNKKILVIASSDFSHYVEAEEGYRLDSMVIEQIEDLNARKVGEVVCKNDVSVCGCGPIMALIEYANITASDPSAVVLKRGNSGKYRSKESVVDYVSMLVYEE
ncbi:AmmeMemoRadiSam system protein B [Bacteroidota bacterium]